MIQYQSLQMVSCAQYHICRVHLCCMKWLSVYSHYCIAVVFNHLPPREHLGMSGDIFGCHNLGLETRNAAEHTAIHRPTPHDKRGTSGTVISSSMTVPQFICPFYYGWTNKCFWFFIVSNSNRHSEMFLYSRRQVVGEEKKNFVL